MEKKCYVCGAPMHRQGQMCDACLDKARKTMEKAIFPKELNEHRKKAADSEELERLLYLTREDVFGDDEYDEDYEDEEYDDEEFEDEELDEAENEEIVLNIRIPYGCRKITINIEEE